MTQQHPSSLQTIVASGVLLMGLGLAAGAVSIPSAAGYGGVGPNFLPWLVSVALIVCGVFMVLVAVVLIDSVRVWAGILNGRRTSQVCEAPFVLSQLRAEEL